MKIITREILPFQEKDFFFPIRDKIDYTKLIIYAARILLLEYDAAGSKINCSLKLIIDKMSRLFFYKNNKYFSVSFPFIIKIVEGEIEEIYTYSGIRVDNQLISAVISIISTEQFKLNPSTINYWAEAHSSELLGLSLLEEIILFESAYVRYDVDPVRQNGKLHPLCHIDINYSSYGTYKLGINTEIKTDYFENLLNISTECSFIID